MAKVYRKDVIGVQLTRAQLAKFLLFTGNEQEIDQFMEGQDESDFAIDWETPAPRKAVMISSNIDGFHVFKWDNAKGDYADDECAIYPNIWNYDGVRMDYEKQGYDVF